MRSGAGVPSGAWRWIRGIAVDAGSRAEFRAVVLRTLMTWLGGDGGFLLQIAPCHESPRAGAVADLDPSFIERCQRDWDACYATELVPTMQTIVRAGGLAASDQVRLSRTAYHADIIAPQGVRQAIHGLIDGHGDTQLGLWLTHRARRRVRFDRHVLAHGRALLPVISIGDSLLARPARATTFAVEAPIARLTRREREVVELLVLGYTNAEIALGLGTSTFTVRNQLASIFRKAHVSTRAELASLAARGGVRGAT